MYAAPRGWALSLLENDSMPLPRCMFFREPNLVLLGTTSVGAQQSAMLIANEGHAAVTRVCLDRCLLAGKLCAAVAVAQGAAPGRAVQRTGVGLEQLYAPLCDTYHSQHAARLLCQAQCCNTQTARCRPGLTRRWAWLPCPAHLPSGCRGERNWRARITVVPASQPCAALYQ